MEKIFGVWYENKLIDAATKTVSLIVVAYLVLALYGFFGGKPAIGWNEFPIEALVLVIVVAFGAFYYASNAHRKYRKHLIKRHGKKFAKKKR